MCLSPGVEDSNLASFLFDRWEPEIFPIEVFNIRRRRIMPFGGLGYFVEVDFDSNNDNNNDNDNIQLEYRNHFQDEYKVDPDESYTTLITNTIYNNNTVSIGIYRTILIGKFNSTRVMGFHEKFLHFLGVFDTNPSR